MGLFSRFIGKVNAAADTVSDTVYAAGNIVKSGADAVAAGVGSAGTIGFDALATGATIFADDVIDYGEVGLNAIGGIGGNVIHSGFGLLEGAGRTLKAGAEGTAGVAADLASEWFNAADVVTDVAGLAVGGTGRLLGTKKLDGIAENIANAGDFEGKAEALALLADLKYADADSDLDKAGKAVSDGFERGNKFMEKGFALADESAKDIDGSWAENAEAELLDYKDRTDDELRSLDTKVTNERIVMSDSWDAYVDYVANGPKGAQTGTQKDRDDRRKKLRDAIKQSKADNPGATWQDWTAAGLTVLGGPIVKKAGGVAGSVAGPAGAFAVKALRPSRVVRDSQKRRARKGTRR